MMNANRCLGSWLILLGSAALIGCGSGTAQIPTTYGKYNAKDGTFECDYPEGWEKKGGGRGSSPVWARFTSGSAMIQLKTSLTASLMSGPSGNSNAGGLPPDLEPVHQLHINYMETAAAEYDGYTELPGGPAVMKCGIGPARMSEFNYSTAFGTQMHGYRVTIIGHDKGVLVYCICPESDWKALQPSFNKVLASLERGTPE